MKRALPVAVNRDGTPEAAVARARALVSRYPRTRFGARLAVPEAQAWLDESYLLAQTLAYRPEAPRATSADVATVAPPAYRAAVQEMAAERVTLSGYRLADLLARIVNE